MWQPLSTAPRNTPVKVGGWRHSYKSEYEWQEGVATKGWFLWRGDVAHYFTHWKPVEPPPEQS